MQKGIESISDLYFLDDLLKKIAFENRDISILKFKYSYENNLGSQVRNCPKEGSSFMIG